jgi:hypothetical protein
MADSVILIAEDCEEDVILIQRALAKTKNLYVLHLVRSGEQAISYLSGDGRFGNRGGISSSRFTSA